MAGALAERDFVEKLARAGFTDIAVVDREPFSVDDASLYPLFGDELIAMMRRLLPGEKQSEVAVSIVIRARLSS